MATYLPTLKQLQYLVALKDHGHFSRAADACFVTQSTLSAGIRELETLIGVTLVERTRRVVRFTPLVIASPTRLAGFCARRTNWGTLPEPRGARFRARCA